MRSEIQDCSPCVNHVTLACRANPLRLANLRHLRLEGISSRYQTPSEKWSQGQSALGVRFACSPWSYDRQDFALFKPVVASQLHSQSIPAQFSSPGSWNRWGGRFTGSRRTFISLSGASMTWCAINGESPWIPRSACAVASATLRSSGSGSRAAITCGSRPKASPGTR